MKIVVKHVDNLKSSLIKTREGIPQYLVYKMTEDNIPISCEIANGELEKTKAVSWIQIQNHLDNGTSGKEFTLPVYEVSYDEFKNNVLRNETSYVGN